MGRHFKRVGDDVRVSLRPVEVELLRSTREQLRRVLEHGADEDPVVRRLFPSAVTGDDEADRELRALLREDLLARRLHGLDALVEILDRAVPHRGQLRVDLVGDEPLLVLGVLNDLRLAIGASIGLEQLERADLEVDEDTTYRLAVMDHLAWLQEQLLAIVDPAAVTQTGEPGREPGE